MKRRTVKADEWDVTSGWRRLLTCYSRAGKADRVKRRMRRRERHDANREVRRDEIKHRI